MEAGAGLGFHLIGRTYLAARLGEAQLNYSGGSSETGLIYGAEFGIHLWPLPFLHRIYARYTKVSLAAPITQLEVGIGFSL